MGDEYMGPNTISCVICSRKIIVKLPRTYFGKLVDVRGTVFGGHTDFLGPCTK
jgi:hypothetical protein